MGIPLIVTFRGANACWRRFRWSEFVSCDGGLWQARKNTRQRPGGPDWVCVARAGKDGRDGARQLLVRGLIDRHAADSYAPTDQGRQENLADAGGDEKMPLLGTRVNCAQ